MKNIGEGWNHFWFAQVSPAPICLFRILYGALVLISSLLWAPDLLNYFGPHGLVSLDTIQQFEKVPRFSILFLQPESEALVVALYAILLLSSVAVTLGLFTRASLLVLLVCLVSFHHRNAAILNGGDTLLRIYAFILVFSPCGQMFSLDKRKTSIAKQWELRNDCWPQRLLQLQLAAVYCQAFWAKAAGATWWDGTAVYYALRIEEFSKFPMPFVYDQLWTTQLLTYATMGTELCLWSLIWFKKFRYFVLAAGVLMHLAIDWSMNVPLFAYTMIFGYVNFVEATDLRKCFDKYKSFSTIYSGVQSHQNTLKTIFCYLRSSILTHSSFFDISESSKLVAGAEQFSRNLLNRRN